MSLPSDPVSAKACFKCGRTLPLGEFYRHPQMGDGHLGKCKECAKRDVNENRARHSDYYVEYERLRSSRPERREQAHKWQRIRRRKHPEKQQALRLREPQKYKARTAVSNAIRDGRLVKELCTFCGSNTVEAHHHDYSKPLDVIWVCQQCHREYFHSNQEQLCPF